MMGKTQQTSGSQTGHFGHAAPETEQRDKRCPSAFQPTEALEQEPEMLLH